MSGREVNRPVLLDGDFSFQHDSSRIIAIGMCWN